jgi:sodium transport system permease protein
VILGVLLLLSVLFSAIFLGIAVRSQSFKEAQNSLTPVYILSILPAMLAMMPGIEFTTGDGAGARSAAWPSCSAT